MKTSINLLLGFFSAILLTVGLVGCEKDDMPAANPALSYPAGEMALGAGTFTSAQPSVRVSSTPQFSITRVTHNGAEVDGSIAAIDASNGIISVTPASDISAIGNYHVSVRVTAGGSSTDYPDAFKLVVKGILFDGDVVIDRGAGATIPVKDAYFVQQDGTEFALVAPADDPQGDYGHISVDKMTGTVTVDAAAEAGIYPISIKVTNVTNPDGTVFSDVLKVTVESKPYNLVYSPATVTLSPTEGFTSAVPSVRAASVADGTAVTFALGNNFDGQFSIDPATGQISLQNDNTLPGDAKTTYELDINVTNSLGQQVFAKAYTVVVDPDKPIEPITAVDYTGTFPVKLSPGQAWTSSRPSVTGSAIGLRYSIENAPQGVTIDERTGIITMAAGHHMPLLTSGNTLKVLAKNGGMDEGFAKELEFSISPLLWHVTYVANSSANSLVNSGIGNMDRYSFSGALQHNRNHDQQATSIMVRNGFGRASTLTVNDSIAIDAAGATTAQTWPDNTNMNNDWIVSSEFAVPATSFSPAVKFGLVNQWGTDAQNILEVYIVEINASNVYTRGAQDQDDQDLSAKPSNLPWVALATTLGSDASIPTKIAVNTGVLATTVPAERSIAIPESYKGKNVRIAMRYWNPSANTNNSRTYRIEWLRVEDALPQP